MLTELVKYKHNGSFDFTINDNLNSVCNAPQDHGGVYLVYDTTHEDNELIYIGRTGKIRDDGSEWIRKGGIKGRIVNGIQKFAEQENRFARRKAWSLQMKTENIKSLRIEWYVTLDNSIKDCPDVLERSLRQKHEVFYGKLPRWNRE